jgi:hypothetical protein
VEVTYSSVGHWHYLLKIIKLKKPPLPLQHSWAGSEYDFLREVKSKLHELVFNDVM